MADRLIYLDNAATTSPDPEIIKLYEKVCQEYFANPSSIHQEGTKSLRLLDKARNAITSSFRLPQHEAIFTSGATEATNLAIKGFALRYQNRGKHIITTNVEHAATLETVKQLCDLFGFTSTILPIHPDGTVHVEDIKNAIKDDTILVSVMAVNNEVGAINPIKEIGELLKDYPKIAFHVDATQAIGKIDIDYTNVDLLSYSGHKIHGLNGTGALLKNKKVELIPVITGGGQENNLRSGTNDVAGAVALAKATQNAIANTKKCFSIVSLLSTYILSYLNNNSELYEINSFDYNPFIINFSTKTKKASVILEGLSNKGIYVSSISACHSSNETGSYVIKNLGKDDYLAHNSLRISLDEHNTLEEIKIFIDELDAITKEIR